MMGFVLLCFCFVLFQDSGVYWGFADKVTFGQRPESESGSKLCIFLGKEPE